MKKTVTPCSHSFDLRKIYSFILQIEFYREYSEENAIHNTSKKNISISRSRKQKVKLFSFSAARALYSIVSIVSMPLADLGNHKDAPPLSTFLLIFMQFLEIFSRILGCLPIPFRIGVPRLGNPGYTTEYLIFHQTKLEPFGVEVGCIKS